MNSKNRNLTGIKFTFLEKYGYSNNNSFSEKTYKYFLGYMNDDYKIKP